MQVALFGENGPCTVNPAGDATIRNNFSWNSNANLLYRLCPPQTPSSRQKKSAGRYVDQPAGTGFSYGTGMDHNEVGLRR